MKKPGIKAFFISCALWLIPGLVAGGISAGFLSVREYKSLTFLTGAVLEGDSLPAALKYAAKGTSEPDSRPETGKTYLEKYGYYSLDSFWHFLPDTLGICVFLFEAAGCAAFLIKRREWAYQSSRIQELTAYLKAANHGEAPALTRREDVFSHLEDEIYKTVAELAVTKEAAVKDHEVLSARTADIAHQLKTPLTSMSLMAELLNPAAPEDEEYLNRLRSQVERLRMLSDGLLTLAKLDSHTLELQVQEVELEELIQQALEPLRELLKRKNIELIRRPKTTDRPQELWLKTDLHWTAEALLNVIKNCAEHTPENGKIFLDYSQNPLYTEITVEDSGNGFSKKDLPHLFERFYKGEHAQKDSAGIGLALARLILEKQNGVIHAENSPQNHARFIIRIYEHV